MSEYMGLVTDAANPNFSGAFNPDSRLLVRFYSRAVQNEFETNKQGRPIFMDVDYVEISIPGDHTMTHDTPVRDDHKQRFPLHWAHYQNTHGKDAKEIGTPLSAWPILTAAQCEEMRALKFRTVEHVAHASDAQIQALGMTCGMAPMAFRDRALRFLEVARGEANVNAQAEELKKRDDKIKAMEDTHAKEMAEIKAQLNALAQAATRNKGGRPRKVRPEEATSA